LVYVFTSLEESIVIAYSQDLRDRVLAALERKESPTQIALRFEVSRDFVHEVKKRFEREGLRDSRPQGGYRTSCVAPFEAQLREWIKEQPDLTLAELCKRLAGEEVSIKESALWHQLNKWGLTFKKNSRRRRAVPARRGSSAP
jgi:transposase